MPAWGAFFHRFVAAGGKHGGFFTQDRGKYRDHFRRVGADLIAHGFDRIRRGAGKSGKNYLAAFDLHGVFEQSFNAHIGNFMLQRFNFLFFFLQLRGDGLRLLRQLRRLPAFRLSQVRASSASS